MKHQGGPAPNEMEIKMTDFGWAKCNNLAAVKIDNQSQLMQNQLPTNSFVDREQCTQVSPVFLIAMDTSADIEIDYNTTKRMDWRQHIPRENVDVAWELKIFIWELNADLESCDHKCEI